MSIFNQLIKKCVLVQQQNLTINLDFREKQMKIIFAFVIHL